MKIRLTVKDGVIEGATIEPYPFDEDPQEFPSQTIDEDTETIEIESVPFDMEVATERIVAIFEWDEDSLLVSVKD